MLFLLHKRGLGGGWLVLGWFCFLMKCSAECMSSEKDYQGKNLQGNKESYWVKSCSSVCYFHNSLSSLEVSFNVSKEKP